MPTTTSSGAKKINSNDNWRLIFDCHNDTCDAIDTLNSKLSGENRYSATAGAKFTINSRVVYKIGSYVFGSVVATATQSYGTSDVIFTVADEVKPSATEYPLFVQKAGTDGVWCGSTGGSINTSGQFTEAFTGSGSANEKLLIVFTYSLV